MSLHLSHADLVGNDIIGGTQSQLSRHKKALETGKGVIIKMSKTQLARNMKIEGGFLSLLAGLAFRAIPFIAKTVLPALGVGALSSLASTGVQKLVGDGLKALTAGEHLSLHLSHADLVGNDIIGVTQSQLSRRKKALETGKGVIIKMSKTQVAPPNLQFQYTTAILLPSDWKVNSLSEMTTAYACVPAASAWLKTALTCTSTTDVFSFSLCLLTSKTNRGYSDL